jgi:hypothetical protein
MYSHADPIAKGAQKNEEQLDVEALDLHII